MDREQIGLKLTLDALGLECDLSDFDRRLVLQKTIYLVQAAKVDLGYTFRWYLRGPYSPGLTRDAFALKAYLAGGTGELKDWKFDADLSERLARFRDVLRAIPAESLPRRLELLASVHFLLRTRQAKVSNIEGLREILRRNDKHFSEPEILQAITDLKQYDLFPPDESR